MVRVVPFHTVIAFLIAGYIRPPGGRQSRIWHFREGEHNPSPGRPRIGPPRYNLRAHMANRGRRRRGTSWKRRKRRRAPGVREPRRWPLSKPAQRDHLRLAVIGRTRDGIWPSIRHEPIQERVTRFSRSHLITATLSVRGTPAPSRRQVGNDQRAPDGG